MIATDEGYKELLKQQQLSQIKHVIVDGHISDHLLTAHVLEEVKPCPLQGQPFVPPTQETVVARIQHWIDFLAENGVTA